MHTEWAFKLTRTCQPSLHVTALPIAEAPASPTYGPSERVRLSPRDLRRASPRRQRSPIPDRRVAGRVAGADVGAMGRDALVVEEQLRPVAPVSCHLLVVDVGRGVLRILPPSRVVRRDEQEDWAAAALLNVGRPVGSSIPSRV